MKRRELLKCMPVAAAPLLAAGLPALSGCAAASGKITVMNPEITEKLAERVPLAPRLTTLEGKTIWLVDTNYEGMGPTPVMQEMRRWFAQNMPAVKTEFRLKSGNYAADDPALWQEIAAAKGDGVIIGVAG